MNREITLYSPIPKQSFSRIGWAIFAFFSVSLILQFLLSRLLLTFAPSVLEGVWGPWLLSSVPMYTALAFVYRVKTYRSVVSRKTRMQITAARTWKR